MTSNDNVDDFDLRCPLRQVVQNGRDPIERPQGVGRSLNSCDLARTVPGYELRFESDKTKMFAQEGLDIGCLDWLGTHATRFNGGKRMAANVPTTRW